MIQLVLRNYSLANSLIKWILPSRVKIREYIQERLHLLEVSA